MLFEGAYHHGQENADKCYGYVKTGKYHNVPISFHVPMQCFRVESTIRYEFGWYNLEMVSKVESCLLSLNVESASIMHELSLA